MSFQRPMLVSSQSDADPAAGQKSCANLFVSQAGRGRGRAAARRAHVQAPLTDAYWLKQNLPALWGEYVRGRFRSREACAEHFGVAFQTVCNWFDGLHSPAAAVFAKASIEDGSRLHAVMTGAR